MTRYEHATSTSVTGRTLRGRLQKLARAELSRTGGVKRAKSARIAAMARIMACVIATVVAFGYYSHVRAQEGNNPGTIVLPLRPLASLSSVPVPPIFGVEGIVADKNAAIQLGKALFWDMQAGSDDTQACASCHFNAGADSRPANVVNPGQAGGDNTFQMGPQVNGTSGPNYIPHPGSPNSGFGGYHDGDFPFHKLADPNNRMSIISDVNDVAGSAGVFSTTMGGVIVGQIGGDGKLTSSTGGGSSSSTSSHPGRDDNDDAGISRGVTSVTRHPNVPDRKSPTPAKGGNNNGGSNVATVGITPGSITSIEKTTSVPDPVFSYPDPTASGSLINTRQVTGRNTPSVVNAVFNFRNFWDGRAQNICNGNNPFGTRDKDPHLLVVNDDGRLSSAFIAMKNSALCSQALGPILSSVEMSAQNRDFHQVGKKLLARTPLAKQQVEATDSVLGILSNAPNPGLNTTYSDLIKKAFTPEWWQFSQHVCLGADGSTVVTVDPASAVCPANTAEYSQMEFNFSLFWGVAIQMYESTLVADRTPLDRYLEQQQTYSLIGDSHQQQFTIQLKPNIDPFTVSVIELNPHNDFSDADVYAFDNGYGGVIGEGLTQATIDYATGTLKVYFDIPPKSAFPIKINYSVGPTPMTAGQLRGFLLFQTKGRCVVCHGGPELSNAAVDTVTPNPVERMVMGDLGVRVYDTGYYHIGVRPGAEDAGLAGNDPVAKMPLSQGEVMRQRVCSEPGLTFMVPGRPGDGISQAPLGCNDDIARTGFLKAPQLRNVALTAPYFHNGSQLTLEQVVEFYNRGGDFNQGSELSIMDPDIARLGLTLQEKQDLVDFLRNGLTDSRTVAQSAPFDHPQLILANGHTVAASGYPVQNDPNHSGQALDNLMMLPATGANGGKPIASYLDNLVGVKNARPN
jgi:cytochrome c peroxidase